VEQRTFATSVSVSVIGHALLMLILAFYAGRELSSLPHRQSIVIEVTPLPSLKTKNRIVQTEAGKKAEKAIADSFLGKETRVVDEQSVAKEKRRERSQQVNTARRFFAPGRASPLGKFGVRFLPVQRKLAMTQPRKKDQPQWAPQAEWEEEFVKGVKKGDKTALNTKEFVYFGYFQRIRKQLDLAWKPILRRRLRRIYRKGRRLASDMDHTTQTLVTLNQKGEVVRVQVMKESGTFDLDDAAIRAFNLAGPFPNPPEGLIDEKGLIQIRWDFVLRT